MPRTKKTVVEAIDEPQVQQETKAVPAKKVTFKAPIDAGFLCKCGGRLYFAGPDPDTQEALYQCRNSECEVFQAAKALRLSNIPTAVVTVTDIDLDTL